MALEPQDILEPPPQNRAGTTPDNGRYAEAKRVTLIGSAIDLVLGVVKIIVGVIGGSQALIADGIHSLSDLATDFMVLYAMKHGSREADAEHPYGHGRFETLATILLGMALIGVAVGIAWDAVTRLMQPELLMHPGLLALGVALISIASKEWIYHYTMHAARKFNSNLLRANAWHSRSDAISSVIVAIGVIGFMAGVKSLDAIAAIGVAVMIAKIGIDFSWQSARELVDTAMEPEQVAAIRAAILGVDDVQALHLLRTRRMGSDGLVDVHILVHPRISVSEGHRISDRVRSAIIRAEDSVTDVMVHIDPEDDETSRPSAGLPLRSEIQQRLRQYWQDEPAATQIDALTLHYLDGKIHVEVLLPFDRMGGKSIGEIGEAQASARRLADLAAVDSDIAGVDVYFH